MIYWVLIELLLTRIVSGLTDYGNTKKKKKSVCLVILQNTFSPTNREIKWTILYLGTNGLIIQSVHTVVARRHCTARFWTLSPALSFLITSFSQEIDLGRGRLHCFISVCLLSGHWNDISLWEYTSCSSLEYLPWCWALSVSSR